MALDLPPDVDEQWEPLLTATADHFLFYEYYEKPTREDVIYFMTFDKRNPNSIVSCLYEARENARTIRETIIQGNVGEHQRVLPLSARNFPPTTFATWILCRSFSAKSSGGASYFMG